MIDARGHMVLIGAGADEEGHARRCDVARRHASEQALDLHLGLAARQIGQVRQALVARDVGEESVDRIDADAGEHVAAVGLGQRQVTHDVSYSGLSTCTSARMELAM